jgi:hypothetical protein
MRRKRRIAGLVAAVALAGGVAAPAALAGGSCHPKPPKCEKPGYGYGDKNHCHYGPPGQGFTPFNPYWAS